LIDSEEYFFLIHDCPLARGSGSPSPRRLENYDSIRENLKTVTEQRDRLAEALKKAKPIVSRYPSGWDFSPDELHDADKEIAESLQSLTTSEL
jgi:hypothetical protein